jgi:LacI family transcriptional regulator
MLSGFLDGGGDPLTAIVCANDDIAARLIVQMRAHGRRVPEDIAVTGFGNMLAPLLDALQLTTMAQPFERMGYVAGEMTLARLNGPVDGIQEVELPMELIVRSSCGSR